MPICDTLVDFISLLSMCLDSWQFLEGRGVVFHVSRRVKELVGEESRLKRVVLDDGTSIDADLCVVAVG